MDAPATVYEDRRKQLAQIEGLRKGRHAISFFNFDRQSEPSVPGLTTHFSSDTKELFFRVLKESVKPGEGIDLILYTRGVRHQHPWDRLR